MSSVGAFPSGLPPEARFAVTGASGVPRGSPPWGVETNRTKTEEGGKRTIDNGSRHSLVTESGDGAGLRRPLRAPGDGTRPRLTAASTSTPAPGRGAGSLLVVVSESRDRPPFHGVSPHKAWARR